MKEKIIVLDFGGQYTQLIARTVRQCNVFSEIKPHDCSLNSILEEKPKGIILSGGPRSVYEKGAPLADKKLFEQGIPMLGICYGMQQMNHTLVNKDWWNKYFLNFFFGDGILHGEHIVKEYGEKEIKIDNAHPLFSRLDEKIIGWMSHGDSVDGRRLASGFRVIAETKDHVAAIANDKKKIYGVQFHPEVTHTPKGKDIISNFVHDICGCGSGWTMGNYIEECKRYIKETVGKNDVICFVSGGVDSSFVATVLAKTEGIGKIYNVYIEGLMRKNETEEVEASLRKTGVALIVVKAEDRFINAIEGMSDPEQKRKTIGNLFGKIMQEKCSELKLDPEKTFLAQGTLYTDRIESGKGVGRKAATIKSHHNVGCKFIEEMEKSGRIVEPNRLIFKDEVREAAREIGLPPTISERQPFPGPGLGIRIVNGNPEWVNDALYKINDRVSQIAREEGLEGYVLPIKTVGVQGDGRTYSYLALLRGERNWQKIRKAAKRIPEEIHDINRIVYEVKPRADPVNISSLIPTTVSRETIDLLKDVDYEGRGIIDDYGFSRNISQTIFVLFGADIYNAGKRSVASRNVLTDDFMTVSPIEPLDVKRENLAEYRKKNMIRMSWECLDEIHDTLIKKYNVGAYVIDVTDKPPATTCME
ncbi:MAG: glutamine-hydrolyzing GMP synthase [Candidatus Woesearchaeota archaeon]|nr:glutamine-hydrolyzing GMP synthase [Candidatus Woesearchaeota archaeon]